MGLDAPDFQAIFESLPTPIVVIRADYPAFTIVAANSAYGEAKLTAPHALPGCSLLATLPAGTPVSTVERLRESLRAVIATKSAQGENSPVLGADGEVRFIIHRITESAGPPATETYFQLAFSEAPIGMVLLTPEGRLVEENRAYLEMLGYTHEELASRDSSRFTHPEDVVLTRNFFTTLQKGPQSTGTIEKRYFRKNGEMVWSRASVTMRRDSTGTPVQAVAIVEDITERKRAEIRYRFLAESIPQMVWTATPDGLLDYVNTRGTSYFGVPERDLLGSGWLQWVHPEDQQHAVEVWQQSLATGARYDVSFRLKRGADNTWRWHLALALPLSGEQGKIVQWFGTCTDIEDQKEAAANLYQQWHNFDSALAHTPDLTYVLDLSGRVTYANRALLGRWQKTFAEAIGKNFFELGYPPDLASHLYSQVDKVIDSRAPFRDQMSFTHADGVTGYYDYIFAPVLDEQGHIRAVAGSTRDVTEQNRVARQIEDDRRRWRELLRQTPAAIAVLKGPEHTFEWVNPDYVRLVGRTAEYLIGKSVSEALPEVAGQSYLDLLDCVYQTGEPWAGHESNVRLQRPDGSSQDSYVNFVYLPSRDLSGNIDGIFVHITDVTDAVLARKRLEESERQFRTLAETIPHLAWMADHTGHIFWYNRRWYDFTGTSFEEIEGWGWQKLHDPRILPDVLTLWQQAISSGEPFEMVFPLRRNDGEFRQFLTRVEPVRDSQGQVVRWFGTNTDITDQRRTEEELRRMNRELEEFAYVASHDLQEPLRMVNIYTELLLMHPKGPPEKAQQYSTFIRQGVLRMEALIHDLLTFSRSVHIEPAPSATADLAPALAEAIAVLKSRIQESGASITAPSVFPQVRGDEAQLAHVFQNILSNAIKYRKTGLAPDIRIASAVENGMCVVSIGDNGIGFEQEYAERIFGLFKRLHKEEYPGTGLGLAICKRIVERYGGRILGRRQAGCGRDVPLCAALRKRACGIECGANAIMPESASTPKCMIQITVSTLKFGELGLQSAPFDAYEVIHFKLGTNGIAVARVEVEKSEHPVLKVLGHEPRELGTNSEPLATVASAQLGNWSDGASMHFALNASGSGGKMELVLSGRRKLHNFWWRSTVKVVGGEAVVQAPALASDPHS